MDMGAHGRGKKMSRGDDGERCTYRYSGPPNKTSGGALARRRPSLTWLLGFLKMAAWPPENGRGLVLRALLGALGVRLRVSVPNNNRYLANEPISGVGSLAVLAASFKFEFGC